MKVLVVCHGNINRSPLCAAVLALYPGIELRQGAVKDWHRPERAARKMREAAEGAGLSLEGHRSRPVLLEDLEWADAILYMDGGNLRRLCAMAPPGLRATFVCLGQYGAPAQARIADPNYMKDGSSEFVDVVHYIINASHVFAQSGNTITGEQQ